jgi:hypothetical protein
MLTCSGTPAAVPWSTPDTTRDADRSSTQ